MARGAREDSVNEPIIDRAEICFDGAKVGGDLFRDLLKRRRKLARKAVS